MYDALAQNIDGMDKDVYAFKLKETDVIILGKEL